MFDTARAEILGNGLALDRAQRTAMRSMFPYAVSEADLLGSFRVERARECLNRTVTPGTGESLAVDRDPAPPPPRDEQSD